jgi:hypothetical protein
MKIYSRFHTGAIRHIRLSGARLTDVKRIGAVCQSLRASTYIRKRPQPARVALLRTAPRQLVLRRPASLAVKFRNVVSRVARIRLNRRCREGGNPVSFVPYPSPSRRETSLGPRLRGGDTEESAASLTIR